MWLSLAILQGDELTPEGGISFLLSITGAQMTTSRHLELLQMDPIFNDLNGITSNTSAKKKFYLNTDCHWQNLF